MKLVWGKVVKYQATEYANDDSAGSVLKVTTEVISKHKDFLAAQEATAALNTTKDK